MSIRIAINGFGRIGRNIARALHEYARTDEFTLVAINDLSDVERCAHLLRYDSTHGRFNKPVYAGEGQLIIDGVASTFLSISEASELPWEDLEVDVVLECTGAMTDRTSCEAHLYAGAPKVLISAPAGTDVDATIVFGINHDQLRAGHEIVSNASCTTNCLAPLAKALNDTVGIEHGLSTTTHAYTNDQNLTDTSHKDLRRARAAAISMIPTKTGAAQAVGLVLPELAGRMDGLAIRVPTVNVSLVDLTFNARRATDAAEIKQIIKHYADTSMAGILKYSDEALVSIDFNHDPASCIFDAPLTKVTDQKMVKVMAWYDNEWGFSNRMLDTAAAWMKAP